MIRRLTFPILKQARSGDTDSITITTPSFDFVNDRIFPQGLDIGDYMRGPRSVNFAHDHLSLPVARTVDLAVSSRGVRAIFQWLDHAFARELRGVFDAGALGASIEIVPVGEPVQNERGGWDFRTSKMVGWGFTGFPANPDAVKSLEAVCKSLDRILAREAPLLHPVLRQGMEVLDDLKRLIERERHRMELERTMRAIDYAEGLLTLYAKMEQE